MSKKQKSNNEPKKTQDERELIVGRFCDLLNELQTQGISADYTSFICMLAGGGIIKKECGEHKLAFALKEVAKAHFKNFSEIEQAAKNVNADKPKQEWEELMYLLTGIRWDDLTPEQKALSVELGKINAEKWEEYQEKQKANRGELH